MLILLSIARMVLSWVSPDPYNPIVRFIVGVTDPLFSIVRPLGRYVNPKGTGIDFTPYILLLALIFLQTFLVNVLVDYAEELRRTYLVR